MRERVSNWSRVITTAETTNVDAPKSILQSKEKNCFGSHH